jgi:hypothetical protein
MTEISKRFEQLVTAHQRKLADRDQILPVKVERGILVGDVLIESKGNLKNLWKRDRLVYSEVSLNDAAIKLANLMAKNKNSGLCDRIYKADQEYGQWFADWQFLKQQYHKAINMGNYNRADILLAKYEESKNRTDIAKRTVTILIQS